MKSENKISIAKKIINLEGTDPNSVLESLKSMDINEYYIDENLCTLIFRDESIIYLYEEKSRVLCIEQDKSLGFLKQVFLTEKKPVSINPVSELISTKVLSRVKKICAHTHHQYCAGEEVARLILHTSNYYTERNNLIIAVFVDNSHLLVNMSEEPARVSVTDKGIITTPVLAGYFMKKKRLR